MSSVCGEVDSRDADIIFEKPTLNGKKCPDGFKFLLYACSEDAQESDEEENGYKKYNEMESSSGLSPGPDGVPHNSSDEEDEEDFATALQLIFYEPTPVRLISAMKGSREKQGLSVRKLSVKWAPDVYDPPPSLSSHTRCKMQLPQQQQQRSKGKDTSKRNGKKGQKGSNSSRKDKKHTSRNKNGRDNFHVGNPESLCAGSFLRASPTKVHLSVTAQAL